MEREKLEAIRQWSNDPCGAGAAASVPPGTREYFARIEQNRYEEYAPWMLRVFPFTQSREFTVLEIGCGLGTDLLQFARGGATCFGVDLTPVHLKLAGQRFRLENMPVQLARADCERLPFASECFDLVYSFGVIHCTPGIQQAVNEIHRVLRPGGTAWVSVYHRHSAYFWLTLLLRKGLVGGELFRRGWRGLLAEVEYRENSDAQPLVTTYTRRGLRRLFKGFKEADIETHHLERGHFSLLGHWLNDSAIQSLEPHLGWYLVIRAAK